jgi:hypothetical protein
LCACVIPVHELTKCIIPVPNHCSGLTKVQRVSLRSNGNLKGLVWTVALTKESTPVAAGTGGAAWSATQIRARPASPSVGAFLVELGELHARPCFELEATVTPSLPAATATSIPASGSARERGPPPPLETEQESRSHRRPLIEHTRSRGRWTAVHGRWTTTKLRPFGARSTPRNDELTSIIVDTTPGFVSSSSSLTDGIVVLDVAIPRKLTQGQGKGREGVSAPFVHPFACPNPSGLPCQGPPATRGQAPRSHETELRHYPAPRARHWRRVTGVRSRGGVRRGVTSSTDGSKVEGSPVEGVDATSGPATQGGGAAGQSRAAVGLRRRGGRHRAA